MSDKILVNYTENGETVGQRLVDLDTGEWEEARIPLEPMPEWDGYFGWDPICRELVMFRTDGTIIKDKGVEPK